MTNKKTILLITAVFVLLLCSACGAKSDSAANAANGQQAGTSQEGSGAQGAGGAGNGDNAGLGTEPANAGQGTDAGNAGNETGHGTDAAGAGNADQGTSTANAENDIYIIIDQTPKPIEGNSFDFTVNKRPDGYALSEMKWVSDKTTIVNTTAEAIAHGGNDEDGFYISGDGQFSGFIYPDKMKGEEGTVTFTFKNDQGHELTWSKKLTLK
ncbi:hypothetical protein [Paenibacillus humicola]|uniref:hypothetical protein n=1 Tax=Paenibacillus humicola TaxID=3110540 RepID=UPI00237B8CCD|nr:hypothetical protein [Paenibacillus humicola]